MRKYVYMIDTETDQCECYDIKDLMFQLNFIKQQETITNVKLVETDNREIEEDISYSLGQRVIKALGYKPCYMQFKAKR